MTGRSLNVNIAFMRWMSENQIPFTCSSDDGILVCQNDERASQYVKLLQEVDERTRIEPLGTGGVWVKEKEGDVHHHLLEIAQERLRWTRGSCKLHRGPTNDQGETYFAIVTLT